MKPISPQLACGGDSVELGLTGVSREQDSGRPIVRLEKSRSTSTSYLVPGKGAKSSSPPRAPAERRRKRRD